MTAAAAARPVCGEARIVEREAVTRAVARFRFAVDWERPHRAGQSVELRLTAPDGHAAHRFYSIASPPSQRGTVDLLVALAADGEVSRFFHEVAEPGDAIALRGPVGLPFSWAPKDGGPVLLVGGGSGVAQLLAMLRERAAAARDVSMALLYAARTRVEAPHLDELEARARDEPGFGLVLSLSREGESRRPGRAAVAAALTLLPAPPARAFVCGPSGFVATMAALLVKAGVPPGAVRTERFG